MEKEVMMDIRMVRRKFDKNDTNKHRDSNMLRERPIIQDTNQNKTFTRKIRMEMVTLQANLLLPADDQGRKRDKYR